MVLHQSVVGILPDAQITERALHELRQDGFPMERVSVVARDQSSPLPTQTTQMERVAGDKAQEATNIGTIAGGTVGGAIGLIVGLGAAAVFPGVGPIMVLGAAATAVATTLGSGFLGATAGGLLGSLIGAGIPEEHAVLYRDRIQQGRFLVMVRGTDAEIQRAMTVLRRWQIGDLNTYDVTPTAPPVV